MLHSFLLDLRHSQCTPINFVFIWGGLVQGTGGLGVAGNGERGRMGGGTLILLVKIPRKRKEAK